MLCSCWSLPVLPASAAAQSGSSHASATALDSMVERALGVSPSIRAARLRVDAARARVGPAGARPDPMVMAGVQNQPLGGEATMSSGNRAAATAGPDPMTMHMVGVSQTFPFPGKLTLRTTAAQREVEVAIAIVEQARLLVAHDVQVAYYEIAYIDDALGIVDQHRAVLSEVASVTDARYAAGSGTQQDVLRARVDATRLADDANALRAQRRGQLAMLNALLERESDAPLANPTIPLRVARAALPDPERGVRFTSDSLGATAADSPLPSLAALDAMALSSSPMLREHESRIAAQAVRVALAEKASRPDVDVSLQYGQRNGFTDMASVVVSIPFPIQHSRKQDEDVAAARAELEALHAEHEAQVNELLVRIATLYASLDRARTRLALAASAILPQERAALTAALASYQGGKGDMLAVLNARAAVFADEDVYYRALADFAERLADLEQTVGAEIL